ncbi:hypothetical protein GCM10022381_25990 [Leifsonia kafniensis]|uniref:Uncharacterized protein n=1 Tax=Leifsonia kafniensis TaxID=475957 RepID=A0ABP7KMW1_9MICO
MNRAVVLRGDEGGLWQVITQGSVHLFDLDAMTVRRIPGPGQPTTINDTIRPIRSILACRVGSPGRWTMHSDDPLLDYYWHITSDIVTIERLEANVAPDIPLIPAEDGIEVSPLNSPSEIADMWFQHVGPFLGGAEVADFLGVAPSGLDELVNRWRVVRVITTDGAVLYPIYQFASTGPLPGLSAILFTLTLGLDDWGAALWLNRKSERFGGGTAADMLRNRNGGAVLLAANADIEAWIGFEAMRASRWARIKGEFKFLSIQDVANVLCTDPEHVLEMNANGELIGLKSSKGARFPEFQFALSDHAVRPTTSEVLKFAESIGWTAEILILQLCTPTEQSEGQRPVDQFDDLNVLTANLRKGMSTEP